METKRRRIIELPEPNPIVPGPCESCGSTTDAYVKKQKKLYDTVYYVQCMKCGCMGESRWDGPSAVKNWNGEE